MSIAGFRYISPSVFDIRSNIFLLVENFSMDSKISHSNVPLIGGTFGITMEDIDDLERNFNFSAPILLHNYFDKLPGVIGDSTNPKIGYIDGNLCDIYYWLKTKDVFYQNISKMSLDIGKTSKISVDMMTTSPKEIIITGSSITTYAPDFQITNQGRPSLKEAIGTSATGDRPSGRTLNNYDLKLIGTDRNEIVNQYVSDMSFVVNFDWKPIKSIPTYATGTTPEQWLYEYTNSTTGGTFSKVPITMKVLNTISMTLKYTIYIDTATLYDYSDSEGNFPAGLHKNNVPINIAIASSTPPTLSLSDMLSGIMDKWVDFQNTEWRLVNNSIQMSTSEIVKVSQSYNSVYQYNPVRGMRQISA